MLNLDQYRITYKAFKEAIYNTCTTCLACAHRRTYLEGEELRTHQEHFNKWLETAVNKCQTENLRDYEGYYTIPTSQGFKRYNEGHTSHYFHRAGTTYHHIAENIYLIDTRDCVLIYRIDESIPPF